MKQNRPVWAEIEAAIEQRKILNGALPAKLPVEQPTKFHHDPPGVEDRGTVSRFERFGHPLLDKGDGQPAEAVDASRRFAPMCCHAIIAP
jgi:hypothetical protein